MDKHEAHEIICKQLQKENNQLAEQIQRNNTMSIQDLEKLDKIFHLKKDMLTVKEKEETEEYYSNGFSGENSAGNQNGNSGYRGRAMNGRFVSRSAGGNSYSDGYAQGYSEAMNQMNNSGHHIPYYDEPRRW